MIERLRWFWSALTSPADETPIEVEKRTYEWLGRLWCGVCDRETDHTFIEWLPDFVVTETCHGCAIEVIHDIATEFE